MSDELSRHHVEYFIVDFTRFSQTFNHSIWYRTITETHSFLLAKLWGQRRHDIEDVFGRVVLCMSWKVCKGEGNFFWKCNVIVFGGHCPLIKHVLRAYLTTFGGGKCEFYSHHMTTHDYVPRRIRFYPQTFLAKINLRMMLQTDMCTFHSCQTVSPPIIFFFHRFCMQLTGWLM